MPKISIAVLLRYAVTQFVCKGHSTSYIMSVLDIPEVLLVVVAPPAISPRIAADTLRN